MVSQILWKRERMGEQRCISEKLCKVEELCDHLKDMKFEDVHKVDENSKVIIFEKKGLITTRRVGLYKHLGNW